MGDINILNDHQATNDFIDPLIHKPTRVTSTLIEIFSNNLEFKSYCQRKPGKGWKIGVGGINLY